ncbi:YegS/Rv2252/BmrU family lipid kinase [Planctomonas sp. JC2975]|uniref:YegS/Rv2252/BmrU family lipid kinase n=1 Tax=Planctomonas sp. JC2975 TaxID=2729626 RepID=UPI00147672C4|nr:YegS/Rv2252/BmrU family lipid kinase [Planctomonas sp. JC2975]NNC11025.1 YegS/Rv2252/BmrU family lipid kinase [Planctomonas sp. JC2975]
MSSARGTDVPEGAPAVLRIAVAVNPQAAFGRRRGAGPAVVNALQASGHDVIVLTQPNYELLRRETAKVVEAGGVDVLVVVGGDGMVSLGVNIVAQTEVALGIVASGTGNDMARTLGLPIDDTDASITALHAALLRGPRRIDLGQVRQGELTTWFGGVVSAGFDARVNDRANRMTWPKGSQRYTVAMVLELLSFRPVRYRTSVDGVAASTEAMLISVANGRSIGGGMRITPDAELDDGLLDLFIVDRMPKLRLLRVFPKVFRGEHTTLPEVHISRARAVSLEADGVVAYADGERIGPLPVEVSVAPGALLVYA